MSLSVWTACQESAFEHERMGFESIRQALGEGTVVQAWTNFTLFERSGRMYEVDGLLLTRYGLWVLELKHWQGKLLVEGSLVVRQRRPDLRPTQERNPVLQTRVKAQVLASLLKDASGDPKLVYVAPVVVMTHPEVEVRYRSGFENIPLVTVAHLAKCVSRAAGDHPRPQAAKLSDEQLARIQAVLSKMDFARSHRVTPRAFSYNLGELLGEGVDYQDFLGDHSTVAGRRAKIRLFFGTDDPSMERANRRAEREFQLLEGISHDSILAPTDLESTPRGTALLYPYQANCQPFDAWLTEHDLLADHSLQDRLKLWRALGEAVRYAHQRKLLHRSLSPRNLLAVLDQGRIVGFKVTNWHTGRSEQLKGATQHLADLLDESDEAYSAPEQTLKPEVQTTALDLFSLGALGYLLLSGKPPDERMRLPAELPSELQALLDQLIEANPARRTASAEHFLEALDAWEQSPPTASAEHWRILRPLGQGASSLVYSVYHNQRRVHGVMKVAKEPRFDAVIAAEAEVLGSLQHPHIVQLLDTPNFDGRSALVTSQAASVDLSRYLRDHGPLAEAELRELGLQLFDIAEYLESKSLYFCDWKPANLGYERNAGKLYLFDFNLATQVGPDPRVGTPAYRDPHLQKRPCWDWPAERYSLAATLCEMASGEVPSWDFTEQRTVLPVSLNGHRLQAFFQKAFASEPGCRHASLEQMRQEWSQSLAGRPMFCVELDHSDVVSLAMQHNAVPVVHHCKVTYQGDRILENVRLRLRLGDEFSEVAEFTKDSWAPGKTWEKQSPHLVLKAHQLALTYETTHSYLALDILVGDEVRYQHQSPIDVLAYNHWAGSSHLQELLCSFVLPNHPAVHEILKKIEDCSICGYQQGSEHAYELVSEIYKAVSELNLLYVEGSFGFLEMGQKIRTPDQILSHKQGNCLDITCLFAACMRLAGLHPLLVLVAGHAFPGCWLRQEDDPNGHIEDAATLQKALDLGILCLFDSSSVCHPPGCSFAEAEAVARDYLIDESSFGLALDLRSAERSKIRPLPLRFSTEAGQVTVVTEEARVPVLEEVRYPSAWQATTEADRRPQQLWEKRLESWKNRLLDLSTRNKLLDLRRDSNKRILPLLLEQPQQILDELLSGEEFTLVGKPAILRADDPRNRQIAQLQLGSDPVQEEVWSQFEAGRLCVHLEDQELQKRVLELYRSERVSIEETGSYTLYLALGLLGWVESERATSKRHAPVALLPVQLVRTRINEPYKLRWRDEDLRINLTLLRKIATDFKLDLSELEQWPGDQEQPDLNGLLQSLRSALLTMKGWSVHNQAVIGSFSFAKQLMLQDLEHFPRLQESSPVLKGFLEQNCRVDIPLVQPTEVDNQRPEDNLCVLDADSSQLAAVLSSERGSSFVLQGPPGTGKSQTISNMIAQNLARGRTVLFVAEKMAALEVVHRRLQKIGLGPFCLELHSNKANKLEIIRQLGDALNQRRLRPPESRAEAASQLLEKQKELSVYVQAIHQTHPIGYSISTAVSRVCQLAAFVAPLEGVDVAPDLQRSQLEECRRAARELRSRVRDVGLPEASPWSTCRPGRWGSEQGRRLDQLWSDTSLVTDWVSHCQDGIAYWNTSNLDSPALAKAFEIFARSPLPTRNLLTATPWSEVESQLRRDSEQQRERARLWQTLSEDFEESLLRLDLAGLKARFEKWGSSFAWGWFMLRTSRQQLSKVARRPLAANAKVLEQLQTALEVVRLDQSLAERATQRTEWLGSAGSARYQANPDDLDELVSWIGEFRRGLQELTEASPELAVIADRLREWACYEDRLRPEGPLCKWLNSFQQKRERVMTWKADWTKLLEVSAVPDDWSELLSWVAQHKPFLFQLPDWALFVEACQEAERLNLGAFVQAAWSGQLSADQLEPCVEQTLLIGWLRHHLDSPPLYRFRGASHNELVQEFRNLDEEMLLLNRRAVAARLAEKIPDPGNADRGEMAVLQRETKKQRAHKAPRLLFKEIPNLLPLLKPCLLMSPLSIAQFLEPGRAMFDLVIFDEASQIAPWDALGALARGKQWVVVGDSRQLPPTSFFASGQDETELDAELGGQLESILDECHTAGLPETSLTWHYRSTDERLIAFSNCHYYENRLLTFPNSHLGHPRRGVNFRYIPDAVYGRSSTRQNPKEAEEVVNFLVERLSDPSTNQSFGVVTFNQAQQSLIENLLDQRRSQDPKLERHFSNTFEPVFIKNLENVQGDERDVILFSIGYGPDENGKYRLEFGPLNRRGGERRLNVAVSRARQQMWIFSSILPEQIELNRTNARGAKDLRAFLDYARRGIEALERPQQQGEMQGGGLENAVAAALQARGWTVHPHIGCSGYQIDLAVVDPREPARYLAGIECDGEHYCSAATTRDRDRLRSAVLAQLGWRLLRVWCLDWLRDPARVCEELHQRLQQMLEEELPVSSVEMESVLPPEPATCEPEETFEEVASRSPSPQVPRYMPTTLPSLAVAPHEVGAQVFLDLLRPLLSNEGPVSLEYALRRTVQAMGARKVGARIRSHLLQQIDALDRLGMLLVDRDVLWLNAQQKESFQGFRCHPANCPRDLCEVPPVEVDNALLFELQRALSSREKELFQCVARHFGKQKVGKEVAAVLQDGLLRLERAGRIRQLDEVWSIVAG